MQRTWFAVAAWILGAALAAGGASYQRMSFDALVENSTFIVYGRIMDTHAYWDAATRSIWTRTDVQVLDGPKGQSGGALTITEPGGILDGSGELYPGTPQFQRGREFVLFLYKAEGNRLRVTGAMQGVYCVSVDSQTGQQVVTPAVAPQEQIYEEGSPAAQSLKRSAPGPERLSSFLYSIRRKALNR
jgi:hypothetical protein